MGPAKVGDGRRQAGWGAGPDSLTLPLDVPAWSAEEPPAVWGPRAWYWLHSAAISYPAEPPPQVRRAMHVRLWAFLRSLPCARCRAHAHAYARDRPPPCKARRSSRPGPGSSTTP